MSVDLPFLTLSVGSRGGSAVIASFGGLWDRHAPRGSVGAALRAYQKTIPCVLRLRSTAEPDGARLAFEDVSRLFERCLGYGRPRIDVPFLMDLADDADFGELRRRLGSFESLFLQSVVVLRAGKRAEGDARPIHAVRDLDDEGRPAPRKPPWGWRVPIGALGSGSDDESLVERLAALASARIVLDSVNVLTRVADARAFLPSRERSLIDRIVDRMPSAELWRVSDLVEADFLDSFSRLPLA